MTTPRSTSSSAGSPGSAGVSGADVPDGLPDMATLTRLASELFAALPSGAPRVPGGVPDPQLPAAVDPPTGSYPGGGSSPGSLPSPASQPSARDIPSSLNDTPIGPSAVPPAASEPVSQVLPGAGPLPAVARPSLGPSFYFLDDLGLRPSFGLPGEGQLRGGLPSTVVDSPPAVGIEAPPEPTFTRYFVSEPNQPSGAIAPDPHPAFDLHAVRRDFPILSERVNGKQLIWFDNAATTQKPQRGDRSAGALLRARELQHPPRSARVGRAGHRRLRGRPVHRRAVPRRPVADEIVFVRGTTEAINLVAQSWGRQNLHEGDEIVLSHLEHHANIVPWQLIAREIGRSASR